MTHMGKLGGKSVVWYKSVNRQYSYIQTLLTQFDNRHRCAYSFWNAITTTMEIWALMVIRTEIHIISNTITALFQTKKYVKLYEY